MTFNVIKTYQDAPPLHMFSRKNIPNESIGIIKLVLNEAEIFLLCAWIDFAFLSDNGVNAYFQMHQELFSC